MTRNEFFRKIFQGCQGSVELRTFPSKKRTFTKLPKEINEFCEKNKGQDLYFGVATRDGKGGSKENCVHVPGFWADIDFKDTPEKKISQILKVSSIKPTIVVSSGNGLHLYFLFEEPLKASEDLEKYLRALCRHFKGDMASTDISRILRVPGTVNHKYPEKPVVKAAPFENRRYVLKDFDQFLEKEGGEKNKKPFEQTFQEGLSKGERDHEMTRHIGRWITQRLRDEEIIPLAMDLVSRCEQPRGEKFGEEDVRKILESIRNKERRTGTEREDLIDPDPHKGMIKMGDLADMELSIKWVVEKIIPEGAITLVSAMGGTGKTRLMYKMASCIVEGTPFLKDYGCEKKRVYYIDFENPPALVDDMRKGMNLSEKIDLWFVHQKNELYRPKRISDKDWWEWYNKLEEGSILFVDTLRSSSLGFDENSSGDMGEYADRLKKIREQLGITIILEHHTRKGDKRIFRGSSAISDLVDNTLILYLKQIGKKEKTEEQEENENYFGRTFYFGHGIPGEGKTRYKREWRNIVLIEDVGFIRYEDYIGISLEEIGGLTINLTKKELEKKYDDWNDI